MAPGRYGLIDGNTDTILGEVHVEGTGNQARATAYRRGYSDPSDVYQPQTGNPGYVAVCPAQYAPAGPYAFAEALTMLRRSIKDISAPSGILMK
jgi:hypothetical protein